MKLNAHYNHLMEEHDEESTTNASTSDNDQRNVDVSVEALSYCDHDEMLPYANTITSSNAVCLLDVIPRAIWIEYILPFLDRPSWNALQVASKEIRHLVTVANSLSKTNIISPPWPDRCFVAVGATSNSIESFTVSADGEYLACGSVLGTIEVWNRRLGKIVFQKEAPNGNRSNEDIWIRNNRNSNSRRGINNMVSSLCDDDSQGRMGYGGTNNLNARREGPSSATTRTTGSQDRRCSPVGSCLKFAPIGTILACGFENRIFLWEISSYPTPPSKALPNQHLHPLPNNKNNVRRPATTTTTTTPVGPYKVIEIDCHRGTLYEVTYIGFSNDATQLIVRYGKMAYIWTLVYHNDDGRSSSTTTSSTMSTSSSALPDFYMTHQIPLNSSRCQMAASPNLHQLAVTNASNSDDKGMIDVWDLTTTATTTTRRQRSQQSTMCNNQTSCRTTTPPVADGTTCRIIAYDKRKVIRGLEFVVTTTTSSPSSVVRSGRRLNQHHPWLVSASLQGEIKFWMYHPPHHQQQEHHQQNGGRRNSSVGGDRWYYSCIYTFQSQGKIFSMAVLSPSSTARGGYNNGDDGHHGSTYLAVGQAKGQIRVWRVPNLDGRTVSNNNNNNVVVIDEDQQEQSRNVQPTTMTAGRTSTTPHQKNDYDETSVGGTTTMDEYLAADVGDHTHHDNIKLIAFTPDGKSLVASRAYDARIWFQTFHH